MPFDSVKAGSFSTSPVNGSRGPEVTSCHTSVVLHNLSSVSLRYITPGTYNSRCAMCANATTPNGIHPLHRCIIYITASSCMTHDYSRPGHSLKVQGENCYRKARLVLLRRIVCPPIAGAFSPPLVTSFIPPITFVSHTPDTDHPTNHLCWPII